MKIITNTIFWGFLIKVIVQGAQNPILITEAPS